MAKVTHIKNFHPAMAGFTACNRDTHKKDYNGKVWRPMEEPEPEFTLVEVRATVESDPTCKICKRREDRK